MVITLAASALSRITTVPAVEPVVIKPSKTDKLPPANEEETTAVDGRSYPVLNVTDSVVVEIGIWQETAIYAGDAGPLTAKIIPLPVEVVE